MAKKLPKRTVVIVGGGLCAGLISRQLTAKGIDTLVLERGGDHAGGAEATLPNQRDELRWDRRQGLMQNWQRETYTLRHSREEESLPVRWMEAFLPGEGVGAKYSPAVHGCGAPGFGQTKPRFTSPPAFWLTDQLTLVFVAPVTVAVN